MRSYISCKNDFGEYETYNVPAEIKRYIIQLESYIHNPKEGKLLEAYSERFNENTIDKNING